MGHSHIPAQRKAVCSALRPRRGEAQRVFQKGRTHRGSASGVWPQLCAVRDTQLRQPLGHVAVQLHGGHGGRCARALRCVAREGTGSRVPQYFESTTQRFVDAWAAWHIF